MVRFKAYSSVIERLKGYGLHERLLRHYPALKNFLDSESDGYKIRLMERNAEIESPADVVKNLRADYRKEKRECLGVVMLSTRNRVIDDEVVSIGSLDMSIAHSREIFRPAIKASAASVILIHNHPSGDPEPSPQDVDVAERLKKAGELLGIELMDFLIYGADGYTSLKEKKFL